MAKDFVVGFNLAKDDCRISYYNEEMDDIQDLAFSESEHPYSIQNSICKCKDKDEWLIGQDGYETALFGDGAIVDKLLRLVEYGGFATFDGVRYSSEDLLLHFLDETLKHLFKIAKIKEIRQITFTLEELNSKIMDTIVRCMGKLGYDRSRIQIISHAEAYLYYVLSQPSQQWTNMAVLYDLSGSGLNFYEMEIRRGIRPQAALSRRTFLEEGFSIDILDSSSGQKMADSILNSSAERLLPKRNISTVNLSGIGLDHCQEWSEHFLKTICNHRRVYYVENIFARGAACRAIDSLKPESAYPYTMVCEGCVNVDIFMDVFTGMSQKTIALVNVGKNWYDAKTEFDFIPDREDTLRMSVRKLGEARMATLEIPMGELLTNGNKLNRIGVSLTFTSENTFTILLRDKGFGEFFHSSEKRIRKEFSLE